MCENKNGGMSKTIHDRINLLKNLSRGELEKQRHEAYVDLYTILKNTRQFMDNESEELAPIDNYYIYIDNREVRPIFNIGILLGMEPVADATTALADRYLTFRNIGTDIYSSSPVSLEDEDRTIVIEPIINMTIQIKWHHICLATDYITQLLQQRKEHLIALIALSNNHPQLILLHTFLQYYLCSEFGIYLGDENTPRILQPRPLIFSHNEMDEMDEIDDVGKGGTRSKSRSKKNRTKKNKQKKNKLKKNKQKKTK